MISRASVEPEDVDTTATSSVKEVVVPIPQTMTTLVKQVKGLRDRVQATSEDVADLHRRVNAHDLDRRTHFKVRTDMRELLDVVAVHYGMSWNQIAQLVGVSPQAVRKWRKGEPATPENRFAVARLASLLDLLVELRIANPAQWLEVPLVSGYTVTALNILAARKVDLVIEWADLRIDSPERLLDQFDSRWREKYKSEYETFVAGDDNLSLRRR
jgi:transcriptional regulator with XRE-family HTH domain